ncbi:MAG TPA: hypothetical protein VGG23_09535, partial [Acidimicrobiales bacterium]
MTEAAAQDEDDDRAERGQPALTNVSVGATAGASPRADGGAAARPDIAASARTVLKIGSSSLTRRDGTIDDTSIATLVGAIATRIQAGHQVLLVTS